MENFKHIIREAIKTLKEAKEGGKYGCKTDSDCNKFHTKECGHWECVYTDGVNRCTPMCDDYKVGKDNDKKKEMKEAMAKDREIDLSPAFFCFDGVHDVSYPPFGHPANDGDMMTHNGFEYMWCEGYSAWIIQNHPACEASCPGTSSGPNYMRDRFRTLANIRKGK